MVEETKTVVAGGMDFFSNAGIGFLIGIAVDRLVIPRVWSWIKKKVGKK